MKKYSSSVTSLLALITTLEKLGVDKKELLQQIDLSEDIFQDVNNRVEFYTIQNIWKIGLEKTEDYLLGLKVGESIEISHLGVVAYIILNSKNLQTALEKLCKYQNLISEGVTINIEANILEFDYQAVPIEEHQPLVSFLAGIYKFFATYIKEDKLFEKIELKKDLTEKEKLFYKQHFQCEVFSNREANRAYLLQESLDLTFENSDIELLIYLEKKANQLLEKTDNENFLQQIQNIVYSDLKDLKKTTLESISKDLGFSTRRVQQKLQEENTNFRELIESIKKDIASTALKNMSVSDTAFFLGFTTISSFNRAFKRWYGVTPSKFYK